MRGPKTIYLPDGRPATEFGAVQKIVALADEHVVAVRFIIYPYHAHTLVLFHQADLWPAYEAWKSELVKLVDAAPAGADAELWDFSGFSPYSDERVPRPKDTDSDMRWYWEAGHFKKSLGDVLLARLFDPGSAPGGWGYRLTARNLGAQLQRQRVARDGYELAHAEEVAELATLIAAANPPPKPLRDRK